LRSVFTLAQIHDMFKQLTLLLLLVQLIEQSTAVVKFENLKYELNKDYMHGNIFIKSQNDKYMFGADVELMKKAEGSVIITPLLQHLVKGEYHTMLNIDLDTCKVDPLMSENSIVRTIAKEATKFINFSLMCPYNPGRYLLNDFTLDSESPLLKLIPDGKYQMQLTATHYPTHDSPPIQLLKYSIDFELYSATS
uniref:MD-2-related lipid-recognition domain-containing protein n=2 Tax=Anopheles atroparvus TaxID=41427 RepID=A0A182JIF4_ANOAO